MGASEVIKVLEKNKARQLTCNEIAKSTVIALRCVRRILKALMKDVSVDLEYRDLTFEEKKERFGYVVNPTVRVYWLANAKN